MKAKLISPTRKSKRDGEESSTSRSISTRSLKRRSSRDLLLSSPRQRKERLQRQKELEEINATTPPYAQTDHRNLDRSSRSHRSHSSRSRCIPAKRKQITSVFTGCERNAFSQCYTPTKSAVFIICILRIFHIDRKLLHLRCSEKFNRNVLRASFEDA
ncbi:hypothetical protein Tcan_09338 [Toxocara canis]|uniref:Uncharacterized protein n=1 Tax=Toxocara canis TaxID=6265 RepID=A0A0B2VQ20_TOXCA|nr:hypothetical protein Tcan_09338 [Toxocara canis]